MTFSFLWKGKDKTRRLSAINTLEEGGIKMIDIQNVIIIMVTGLTGVQFGL